MGNNNSVQQNLSNDEIMSNINHLFSPYQQTDTRYDTIHSLDMSNTNGGCVECKRNRYVEFENQLGGELRNADNTIMFNKLAKFAVQSGGTNCSELDDLDLNLEDSNQQNGGQINLSATSNALMSELAHVDYLSATSVGNNLQAGGQISSAATSNMFASEIAKLGDLSATSIGNMTGGCGCEAQKQLSEKQFIEKHTPSETPSSIIESLTGMTINPNTQNGGCPSCVQTAGCPACGATSVIKTSEMFGGKIQSSEEINIMPFYSSTSGSEYYSNMQKAHRYA